MIVASRSKSLSEDRRRAFETPKAFLKSNSNEDGKKREASESFFQPKTLKGKREVSDMLE